VHFCADTFRSAGVMGSASTQTRTTAVIGNVRRFINKRVRVLSFVVLRLQEPRMLALSMAEHSDIWSMGGGLESKLAVRYRRP